MIFFNSSATSSKTMDRDEFHKHAYSFYNGMDGIDADVNATYYEILEATDKLVSMYNRHGEDPCYDSIDRERVREFILEARNG